MAATAAAKSRTAPSADNNQNRGSGFAPETTPITAEELNECLELLGYDHEPQANAAFGEITGAAEQSVRRWRDGSNQIRHPGIFRLGLYTLALAQQKERKLLTIWRRHDAYQSIKNHLPPIQSSTRSE